MAKILRQAISSNGSGIEIEIFDKCSKRVEYNYLVEFSLGGRTTAASKTFIELEEANDYFTEMLETGTYIETLK